VVLLADNGEDAIEMLRDEPVDCVLMDVQMPVLDGYSATRRLRRMERFAALPILAMTANAMVGDRERALESGMNDYVSKPVEPEELRQAVHRWTRGRALPPEPSEPAPTLAPEPSEPLDLAAALRRVNGNRPLLLKMMQRFQADVPSFAGDFAEALAAGDRDQAIRLAHSLKSSAGTLGLLALQRAAEMLEMALREQAGEERIEAMHRAASHALDQAGRLIEEVISASEKLPSEAAETDANPLLTKLNLLRLLIEDADTDAALQCRELAERLPPEQASLGKSLVDYAESYEFPKALTVIDKLIAIQQG
jgi:CheY-like chemotaxis protein/HPt (histidine-containing phosphotransfer) domain-containing protein